MREIVLDTETTGLDPATGDRVVEIGAVELLNGVPTGANFHVYINPERDVPEGAFRVHGLSAEFLKGHPVFAAIASEFSAFIGDDRLVIHNAEFDVKFINAEFARLEIPPLAPARILDTLALARRKHPSSARSYPRHVGVGAPETSQLGKFSRRALREIRRRLIATQEARRAARRRTACRGLC